MLVSPSCSRMTVVTDAVAERRQPAEPVPEMLLTSTFSASDTSSSWWVRGVMSMLTPMFS